MENERDIRETKTGAGVLTLISYALILAVTIAAFSVDSTMGAIFFALLCIAAAATFWLAPRAARR